MAESTQKINEEELLELEAQMAGDDWSGTAPRRAKAFWPSAKRLAGLFSPFKGALVLVAVLNAACIFLSVYAPAVTGAAVDVIFRGVTDRAAGSGGVDFGRLGELIAFIIGMYVFSALFQLWQGLILNRISMRAVFDLRERIEAKIHALPLSHFDRSTRGDLLSRTTNDIDNMQQVLQQALSQLFYNLLLVVGIAVMMFSISWQLALVALVSLPLTGIVIGLIGSRSQKQFATQWRSTGQLNGQVEESFSGHDLALIFGRTEAMQRDFDERNEELYRSATRAQFLSGTMMPIMQFLSYLSYVVIAVFGALRVAHGNMTLGQATAFIQYSREFNVPLGQLGGMMQQVQSGVASAERVFELLDAPEQAPETPSAALPGRAAGRVEFREVEFSYDKSAAEPLISGLNLRVEPGQTAAIVGPTGAGKTTLVNLILRFYELDGGSILLDGRDITSLSRAQLRSQIGMVLQDAVLFQGTIRENIRYGRLDASDEEVQAAAEATYVDRFVRTLPDGYDTEVSQDGGSLSAGERQLITIARAFLAQPPLLILDEATSSVDTRTEMLVQDAMNALRAGRTSFVIAHRLSTINNADLIIVMKDGTIAEQGTHAELLARHGAYWELNQAQRGGQE